MDKGTKPISNNSNIRKWLNDRGISDDAINKYGIHWDTQKITIPVFDKDRNLLFNKYRRLPDKEDGPKYWYDTGKETSPYPVWVVDGPTVTICEGEFDSIILNENGIPAITSTGGAGSFNPEWVAAFKDITVCYDTDHAGQVEGWKLAAHLGAKVVILRDVKDVTDYFLKFGKEAFYALPRYQLEKPLEIPQKITKKFLKELRDHAGRRKDVIFNKIRNDDYDHTTYMEINQKLFAEIYELEKAVAARDKIAGQGNGSAKEAIQQAKQIPLTSLYTGSGRSSSKRFMGKCPFHDDSTASFMIYKEQNTWWCYGCGFGGDVIDFVMRRDGVRIMEAVGMLLNK